MFTGIVEELGTVTSVARAGNSARITVQGGVVDGSTPGDSVAVDGVCLTIAELDESTFAADVMHETLRRSTLGGLTAGARVNLERAATATSRLGGHVVQGHVDGIGELVSRSPSDAFDQVTVRIPGELSRYVVEKGSIAVDGVSLTVMSVADDLVTVGLIPETLRRTTLGTRVVGDTVNIEVDVMAKHVERLVQAQLDRVGQWQEQP